MSTPSFAFVGPVILALADDLTPARPDLVAGLAAAGIQQPDDGWLPRFADHVDMSARQAAAERDPEVAVGEFMLWLGHLLHLGHGMVVDLSFVRAREQLVTELHDRGLVQVVQLHASEGPPLRDLPALQVDAAALRGDPAGQVRRKVLDRLAGATAT